jgi:hypothetical protein
MVKAENEECDFSALILYESDDRRLWCSWRYDRL